MSKFNKGIEDLFDQKGDSKEKIARPRNDNSLGNEIPKKQCFLIKLIIFIISALVISAAIIIIIYVFVIKKPVDPPCINCNFEDNNSNSQIQYKIKTNVGDLKSIYINQRYYEDIKIDGVLTHNLVDRKTNYHISVINEIPASDEEKQFYNKTYLCSISISSECVSTKDEYCLPKKLVDLNDQDYSHVRNLNEIDDLENFPMPLCWFNLTDNNVIMSITCHKNLSESKINSIVLDLYFFRPPGLKRLEMEKGNITITQRNEGDKEIIRETNGGLCEVENALSSFCTTDMNTTKDSEGNLLAYDELAFTNITTDENNYFIKNKYTKLLDKTVPSELNPEKFNETLNKLYPKLEKYMKYYEYFNLESFKEYNEKIKGITNKTKAKRNLYTEKPTIVNGENLFKFIHFGGIQILINLKDNAGYNTESMEAFNTLEIDDKIVELGKLKQFSDIDKVISRLISLSRAGNNLATTLSQKIKDNLNNITDTITINIPNINKLLVYKELSEIFDSSISLKSLKNVPIQIVEECNYLINKLEELFNSIENGSLKNHIRILSDYIYKYIKQSHILINNLSNNLKELGDLIQSPKQAIASISTYYMNNTSTSYINTILEAEKILMNYYINEKDLIIPEVEKILQNFEEITIESIQKQLKIVNNLNSRIEDGNLTINDANDEDYRKIIVNLDNSNSYINNIIDLFKKKVRNEMELKDGYFISKYDIESNNETFNRIIDESLIIAHNLDNNEYIDEKFDNIMIEFRKSFANIVRDMEDKKEEQFPMDEKTLKGEYFKPSEQKKITKELKDLSVDIYNKIKNENKEYLDLLNEKVDKFLNENKEFLFNLKQEIETSFSEEKIENLAITYDNSFNEYLTSITNIIKNNEKLTNTYFNGMERVMTDNNAIVELLVNYPVDKSLPPGCPCVDPGHCWQFTRYVDLIYNKYLTQGYLNKYNIYKAKFESSKNFINDELHSYILEEYKNIISKLKGILQSFKNNKISDKYPEYSQLDFIDIHIGDIDKLYDRLNNYISDDKFNSNYLIKIINYKNQETNEINRIKNYIEAKHKIISKGSPQNDFTNDFCTTFKRRKTYTCTNSNVHVYDEDTRHKCLYSWGGGDYTNLKIPSFIPNANLQKKFQDFYNLIKGKIDTYNNKINELKLIISSIEMQILGKNMTYNYLTPIQEKISSILEEKYSGNLIRGSYNYYKKLIDERLEDLLNNASNKWINSFDLLADNVNKTLKDFKNSMNEFGLMALIYEAVISQNLTKIYYDSIIKHQKAEFNYTISYYYNFLLQNVTSAYQFIFNQIPTNQQGFNNILNMRKKEINDIFNKLFKEIQDSKSEALSLNNQLYFLQVSSSNFFNANSILTRINNEISSILKYKGTLIYRTKNGKHNDEFSLATRFYLENSLNGWQIDELYQPINENIFVYLNLEKFKELLSDNWIFDQDDFINRIKILIYNSNLEIKNSFLNGKKEEYYKSLENLITQFYTKESIASKISQQFKTQIREIDSNLKKLIKENIQEILNTIKENLSNEIERLKTNAESLTNDFSKITQTIENYKLNIINKLENEILNKIVNDFYQNMINVAYTNRIESGLNQYLIKASNFSSTCETYESLSSSYNIGEIIYNIVQDLVIDYKNISRMNIEDKRDEYIIKLKNEAGIEEIKQLINDELNPKFSNLLDVLKKVGKNNPGDKDYSDYDLSNEIKNAINSDINKKMEVINNNIMTIKGDKFYVDLYGWDILDYDDIAIFENIEKDFEVYIKKKIDNEKHNLNVFLKEIIRDNFNILINNLILTFGNEFFDRVIKYNENFKITSLYQNLKYSLVVSLHYYSTLYDLKKDVNALTKDLKIKLYNLNNLDLIADEKNKKVLNLLSKNADDFIEESKFHILRDYKIFLKEDTSIQLSFDQKIINSISSNLEEISSDLENDYISLLNEQFKKRLINSYTKVMNEQTKDMINTVDDLKQQIKSKVDDLFSLDIDKVLNETNYKINVTLDSIKEYTTYFNSFEIPEELISFLKEYGKTTIKPIFKGLENLLNQETKNLTIQLLDKNSKNYEKFYKVDKFIEEINKTFETIKEENIDNIHNEIINYGNNESEYQNNLQNEINRIEKRNLRRLNGEGTEEDTSEEYIEKVADKSIDENFHKLLNSSENAILFVQTFEYFGKFEEKLEKYLKKLNISYKESQDTIDNIYKEEETYDILNERLQQLNNISLNYYLEIKDSFNSLRNYIVDSLKEINNDLNKCANFTYKTFANKYEEISNSSEMVDNEQDKIEEDINDIKKTSISQNTEYTTKAKIKSLFKKARFKFSLSSEGEGNIKKPKVKASVINNIRPKSVVFEISSPFGTCGQNIQKVEVDFNNVSYITDLNFDTKSTLINVTTITNFDSYKYYVSKYKIENSDDNICNIYLGISYCIEEECNTENPTLVEAAVLKTQKQLTKEETISIEG